VSAGNTFNAVAEEFLEKIKSESLAETTKVETRWFLPRRQYRGIDPVQVAAF